MNMDDYMQRVIDLFRDGGATEIQWNEMARAVLDAHARDETNMIDASIGVDYEDEP